MNQPEEDQHPSEKHIAFCAYQIWENEGQPTGREAIHWSNAEDLLIAGYVHHQWYQPTK
jgi:hypothetical protein